MTDKEKFNIALCNIITASDVCKDCRLKHYFEGESKAYCFFANDCIVNDHVHYRKDDE